MANKPRVKDGNGTFDELRAVREWRLPRRFEDFCSSAKVSDERLRSLKSTVPGNSVERLDVKEETRCKTGSRLACQRALFPPLVPWFPILRRGRPMRLRHMRIRDIQSNPKAIDSMAIFGYVFEGIAPIRTSFAAGYRTCPVEH